MRTASRPLLTETEVSGSVGRTTSTSPAFTSTSRPLGSNLWATGQHTFLHRHDGGFILLDSDLK